MEVRFSTNWRAQAAEIFSLVILEIIFKNGLALLGSACRAAVHTLGRVRLINEAKNNSKMIVKINEKFELWPSD